tara:strand:- start:138 stop:371 length:234 start_codon:yes stop_codon:yes gene_type:complete
MSKDKKKETKSDKFNRLASMRVRKILKYLDLLENCSNNYTYEYTDEDIAKIFKAINSKTKQARLSFEKKPSKKGFEL